MFNRKTARLDALTARLPVVAGGLAVLADASGRTPPQIDPFDLTSKAQGLPDEKIENMF
jgi:hypothetical protein